MKAALGRTFSAEEDQPGHNRVAVLSYGLWQRRFGGDPGILGKTVIVDGNSFSIVGVTPRDFRLLDTPSELWMPYTLDAKELSQRGFRTLRVIGAPEVRREPGAGLGRDALHRRPHRAAVPGHELGLQHEDRRAARSVGRRYRADALDAAGRGGVRPADRLRQCRESAAGTRGKPRERDRAAYRARGQSRPLVRQLLTESVLLGLAGGLLGLALAAWSVSMLEQFGPSNLPRLEEVDIDWRVLAFTLSMSVLTGIVFGLAPALSSVRSDLNSILKTSGRGTTGSRSRARWRNALVVSEIASCVVLLAGAGLLIRSFARLENVNPGFRPDHVLTMQIALPETRYSGQKIALFYQQLVERLQALAGVQYAGIARNLPLSGSDASLNFVIENRPVRVERRAIAR